jgi:hypothetical protein
MTQHEQARRALTQGAEYLTRRGWCQHELFDLHGRACLRGAVHTFAPSPEVERLALDLVEHDVGERWDIWHDAPDRTKAEVIATMLRTAKAPAPVAV